MSRESIPEKKVKVEVKEKPIVTETEVVDPVVVKSKKNKK